MNPSSTERASFKEHVIRASTMTKSEWKNNPRPPRYFSRSHLRKHHPDWLDYMWPSTRVKDSQQPSTLDKLMAIPDTNTQLTFNYSTKSNLTMNTNTNTINDKIEILLETYIQKNNMNITDDKPREQWVIATKSNIQKLRALNLKNRVIKSNHVDDLYKLIIAGKWQKFGAIIVSKSGNVIDGGHRLAAIEKALTNPDCPVIEFCLQLNVDEDAQEYMDQHAIRTNKDIHQLKTGKNISSRVLSTIGMIMRFGNKTHHATKKIPYQDIKKYLYDMQDSAAPFFAIKNNLILTTPVIGALVKKYHDTKNPKVIEFANKLITGDNISEGHPAHTLRKLIFQNNNIGTREEIYGKTIYALNAFLENRKITKVFNKVN